MKRQVSNALVWLLLCGLAASLPSALRAATPNGVLFEITRSGEPPSYLFGTMHLDDPKVISQLERVEPLLSRVDRLVMEAVPDGLAMIKAGAAGYYSDGRSLKDVIDAPFYERVATILAERGVPEPVLRRMKPWSVAVSLSLPVGDNTAFLDLRLYNRAEELGLPVVGLETIDEQLGLFDRLDTERQVALLRQTVEQLDELPRMMAEMTDAYRRGDLAYLERVSIEQQAGYDPELLEWFTQTMIERRNGKMLERLGRILTDGRSLIAVGALHLPGPTGLLSGLEAGGYRVRALNGTAR